MTLTDLVDADRDATTPVAAEAVRDWQRAGAELGRTVEELSTGGLPPVEARARMRGAERTLDGAELALVGLC